MKLLRLLLLLWLAGGICAPAQAENLVPRRDEVAWRVQGYIDAGIQKPYEKAVIDEMIVNRSYKMYTIPKGIPVSNWTTPREGEKAFEFRPGKYKTPDEIEVAVFDDKDKRLPKPRVYMADPDKRCFNFTGGWTPPRTPEKPAPKPREVCVKLRICKSVEGDSRLSGFHFKVTRLVDGEWVKLGSLTSDEDGKGRDDSDKGRDEDKPKPLNERRLGLELRIAGRYRVEEVDLPERYTVISPESGRYEFTVDADMETILKSFENRYKKPAAKLQYEADSTPPDQEEVTPPSPTPGRVLGYRAPQAGKTIRSYNLGSAGAYTRSGITNKSTTIIRRGSVRKYRPHPKGDKTGNDDEDNDTPTGEDTPRGVKK